MNKQVFYDPQRKRWKRLRRIFDMLALLGLVLGSVFVVGLMRMKPLPELFLQAQKRNYRALVESAGRRRKAAPLGSPQNRREAGRRSPELG